MKIIEKNIEELKEYDNNPRINDDAVQYVANSIKEFGFKVPVVIDKDNVIVAGHTRVKACRRLGIDKVPCIVADDLTDEQVKAYRLADNKVHEKASWDLDKLELEINDLPDIILEEIGFEETTEDIQGYGDYDNKIDSDNLGSCTQTDRVLRIGSTKIILTDQEYDNFMNKLNKYLDEHGVSFGFIGSILGG